MKTFRIVIVLSILCCMFACKVHKDSNLSVMDSTFSMMPKAVIYKTNGDYKDNVVVSVDKSGNRLLSFPGPRDVSSNSSAIALGNGWLLDRQGGINDNSAFLSYTYEEYSKLGNVPSPSELIDRIIPDARVLEIKVLPISLNEAIKNPELAKKYAK